jgi:hypothetical protein
MMGKNKMRNNSGRVLRFRLCGLVSYGTYLGGGEVLWVGWIGRDLIGLDHKNNIHRF